MTPELTYFIKVNLAFVLLYGFYRLFFYKDTYFTLRRFILLSILVLAFSYPLFNIQDWVRAQQPIVEVIYSYSAMLPEVTVENTETLTWTRVLSAAAWGIYLLIACVLFLRFMIQLFSILQIRKHSEKAVLNEITVYLLREPASPFSFFQWIFLYPANHSKKELDEILTHEYTHVKQWHSIDVVVSELMCIICWLNPFIWLIKREIRHNLEYLADNCVIHSGYDSKTYQFHLLGLAHHPSTTTLYNSFNVLDLKNRISMMNKKRSGKMGKTKYLVFIPLAALLMLFSNMDAIARITKSLTANLVAVTTPVKVKGTVTDENNGPIVGANVIINGTTVGTITDLNGDFVLEAAENATLSISFIGFNKEEVTVESLKSNPQIKLNEKVTQKGEGEVFTVVEEMPRFPGGESALMEFIAKRIKYPVLAQENGIQGRVIASFIVEKDGSISDPEVVRGVDPSLDAEALRVIGLFPQWTPGKQRGMAVRVKYTIPVTFRLTGTDKSDQVEAGDNDVVVVGYGITQAKTQNRSEDGVFTVVEEMPKFSGGDEALLEFLKKNVQYPKDAQDQNVHGRVICSFTVYKDGHVGDIKVVRGVFPSLDAEAVRVIGSMPNWTPGKQRQQAVNVKYTLPITFKAN